MSIATESQPQTMEFKTELKQLLDLIIHSLYTKSEVFLRELISNSADAIDKVRFDGLTHPEMLEGNSDWKIRIMPDEKSGTLTISDNGLGMSAETIVDNLGTIARSGTRAFMEKLKQSNAQDRPELIGQFGVGFYASFMVADRVTVVSKMAGDAPAVRWESDGQGQYTISPAERESRGTDVILHLRDDQKEFLTEWRLRDIVKRYSDFIEHPIVLVTTKDDKTEEATLNSRQAIWLRPKSEIKPEEYNAFYKQIAHDMEDPLKVIHLAADGTLEFRALLFLPKQKPFDLFSGPPKASGVSLYVKRVLIAHDCEELLPTWLRFVKGVVDSSDLPLNVSRETLQHNPILAKIRTNLVNRVLKTLEEMKTTEPEAYKTFYAEFGAVLKEGLTQDFANRERIADLLMLESTKTASGEFTTLEQYVARMESAQSEIHYLVGETRAQIERSPYVESLRSAGEEVLLLTDPIDEFAVNSLGEYKGKRFKAADRSAGHAADSDSIKEKEAEFQPLLESLKSLLSEVKDVKLSARLRDSAACLVADEHAPSAHMERLMQRMGRDAAGRSKRTLEINPDHAVVKKLQALHAADKSDAKVELYGKILLDEAILAEGSRIEDPAAFASRINQVLAGG